MMREFLEDTAGSILRFFGADRSETGRVKEVVLLINEKYQKGCLVRHP
jgi:hypothetical protein